MAKHYVRTDEAGRVRHGFSTDFEQPAAGDICICEDGGRQFSIGGVINPCLLNGDGIPLYKTSNGSVVARSAAEIAADAALLPAPAPSETDRLRADLDYLAMMADIDLEA